MTTEQSVKFWAIVAAAIGTLLFVGYYLEILNENRQHGTSRYVANVI